MRLPVSLSAVSIVLALIGSPVQAQSQTGPAADYPMTIGAPYDVLGTTYTPIDTLNYDAVGHALLGSEGATSIGGGHHTLPIPSYVEVTSLETGRTILVRLDRRGPMGAKNLIELSPGAAMQLGVVGQSNIPVRVRRVNPPEVERAMLRSGGQAPLRMDTPMGLVGVLKRKLDQQDGKANPPQLAEKPVIEAVLPQTAPVASPKATSAKQAPVAAKVATPAATRASAAPVQMAPASKAADAAAAGKFVVQVGAYSSQSNAAKAAKALGTAPQPIGKLWRVRMGPFGDKASADAALAKAKASGYSDARIQRAG